MPSNICSWIINFLTDRVQQKNWGYLHLEQVPSVLVPLKGVLSPLLFSIYTNDCTSSDSTVKILKFADDTTIIGLIHDGDESAYRQQVDQIVSWCSHNNLHLNIGKTVEMIVNFTKNSTCFAPLKINGCTVSSTDSFKFLGTTICSDLKRENNVMHVVKGVIGCPFCTSWYDSLGS